MHFDQGFRCDYFLSMKEGKVQVDRDVFMGVVGEKIAAVEPWSPGRQHECGEFFEYRDRVVLPGFVNGHTHLAMSLFRGLEDDVAFHTWLFERILPLEQQLVNRDFVNVGTRLAAFESIRFGVTCVNDMYFYAEEVAGVLQEMGLRGWVSQTWSQFPLPEDKDLGRDKVKLFTSLFDKVGIKNRVRAALGPHAPYSCSDEMLREVADLSQKTGAPIHMHLCETEKEQQDSFKEFGCSPVKRMHSLGLLKRGNMFAHMVHLTEEDIQLLRSSGAGIVYNPDSNTKLGSGVAPIARLLELGVPVALGSDGAASNNDLSIFSAMDLGTKIQKLEGHSNTAMIGEQAIRAATWGGAEALGLLDCIGSLEVGKQADFISVDLALPHMQPVHSVISQLVYAAQGSEVDNVFCAGRQLLKDRAFWGTDFSALRPRIEEWRSRIQSQLKEL